jgi:outer membrane protein assembly factor BamB
MPKQHMNRARRLVNEQSLYRYNRAFERGDIETIETILEAASHDEELERMIYAMHDLDQTPGQPPSLDLLRSWNNPTSTTHLSQPDLQSSPRRPMREQRSRGRLQTLAAALVVVVLIVSSLLLLHSRHLSLVTGSHTSTPETTKTIVTSQGMVFLLFTNGDVQASSGVTGQHVWSYSTGQDLGNLGQPYEGLIVQSQMVYVMAKNQVYALNENTGTLLWHKTLPVNPVNIAPNESQMLIDAGIVYVSVMGEPQSIAYAMRSSNGTLLWQVASTDVNPPLVTAYNGIAYMSIQNAAMTQTLLEARRGSDGHVLWSYLAPGMISFGTVANNVLYIYAFPGAVPPGDSKLDKRLLAFKTSNGDVIWSRDVHYGNYTTNIVYAQSKLVVDDGGNLCVHSARDGALLWCTQVPNVSVSSFLVGSDTLYIAYSIGISIPLQIEALDLQHGQIQWTSNEILYKDKYLFLALDLVQLQQNTLLVACGSPLLAAVDSSNGHILWHFNGSAPPEVLQIVASA